MDLASRLEREQAQLAPYAVPAAGTLGRKEEEYVAPDDDRPPFEHDWERVVFSDAYRQLGRKTQVFIAGTRDQYRTRLTHTVEVTSMAYSSAGSERLRLNRNLAMAIAMAHDLGHPPFGHVGEAALNEWMQGHGLKFDHNSQSHWIVSRLEPRTEGSKAGLNLNGEVLEGLLKHRQLRHARTLEAQLVDICDRIAYLAHDTEDGLRSGLITLEQIQELELGRAARVRIGVHRTVVRHGINGVLLADMMRTTSERIQAANPESIDDIYHRQPEELVAYSPAMKAVMQEYYQFLLRNLYNHPKIVETMEPVRTMIHALCSDYLADPPAQVLEIQQRTGSTLPEAVKDYVAGMTDDEAKAQYAMLATNH